MGRFMDRRGRAIGLRVGFTIGVVGTGLVFVGTSNGSVVAFLLGLVCVGMCGGTINLARAGAADMYPPDRRARGISYVLLGAAVGAIISPIAFSPLLAGVRSGTSELAVPWLVAGTLLALGVIVTFGIRIDPVEIAARGTSGAALAEKPKRALGMLVRLPGVAPAMFAAVVAQAIMSGLMTVIGLAMVRHGHDFGAVALTMSVHFIGMFGLVLVAGHVVDWLGRQRSIALGLSILAGGVLILPLSPDLIATLPGMFAIGLGWNLAFVGSTAVMGDAAGSHERAGLLGFNDFLATGVAAGAAVGAGMILGMAGLVPLAVMSAIISLLPLAVLRGTNGRPAGLGRA
jgi:MFS family permease